MGFTFVLRSCSPGYVSNPAAGAVGGLVNFLIAPLFGALHITTALGVHIAPGLVKVRACACLARTCHARRFPLCYPSCRFCKPKAPSCLQYISLCVTFRALFRCRVTCTPKLSGEGALTLSMSTCCVVLRDVLASLCKHALAGLLARDIQC